jgi:hypothetical protein
MEQPFNILLYFYNHNYFECYHFFPAFLVSFLESFLSSSGSGGGGGGSTKRNVPASIHYSPDKVNIIFIGVCLILCISSAVGDRSPIIHVNGGMLNVIFFATLSQLRVSITLSSSNSFSYCFTVVFR